MVTPPTLPASGPLRILIVDDEPAIRRILTSSLERDGLTITTAASGQEAVQRAKQGGKVDVLVTDLLMPDRSGIDVMNAVRKLYPDVRTILISGHATVRAAVEAMRMGAFDFITKPFDIGQVRVAVERALEMAPSPAQSAGGAGAALPPSKHRGRRPAADPSAGRSGLIGDAPATEHLRTQLLRVASARSTVLLLGESGVGKEVAARLLHERSLRRDGPFVAVSCAALPDSLLESELFGHEKSAFTGAAGAKPGRFELAHGGTLFLDEIGDIPSQTQVKLLRALQEREVSRIGGIKSVPVDVRVVAATNRDLYKAVQEGTFRLDLYYRLHVVPIRIPPLRERREDIAPLAEYFLARLAPQNEREFPGGLSSAAIDRLQSHSWPGNIRELQNAIEYAVVLAPEESDTIEAADLPPLLDAETGA